MIKKLFQTTAARSISAFLGLVILTTNARYIGSDGVGQAALFNLWVSIFVIIGNLLGGSAMVYYAPRYRASELMIWAYLWAVFSLLLLGITSLILYISWVIYLMVVVFFYSTGWAHQYLLVGKNKLQQHNVASLMVNSTLLMVLIVSYTFREPSVDYYFLALSAGSGAQWLLSLIFMLPVLREEGFTVRLNSEIAKSLLRDGFHIQVGNLIQQFNYRFTYFFINSYWGTGAVGVFSAVVQLGEGIWLLAKSVSLVVYSRVSQSSRDVSADILTFVTARWVAILSGLAMLLLAMVPGSVFNTLLGGDFADLGRWLMAMSPAVAILAAGMVYSHYVAGKGYFYKNFMISLIAFMPILLLGDILIGQFGLAGAVLVNLISYSITALGSLLLMLRMVHPDSKVYIWRFKPDIQVLTDYWRLRKSS